MATHPLFGSTILPSTQTSAFSYYFNDFMMRRGGLVNVWNTTTSAPPGSPTLGDAYLILNGSPTGVWSGKTNYLTIWYGNQWNFIAPFYGMRVYDRALDADVGYYDPGVWFYPAHMVDAGSKGTGTYFISGLYNASKFTFNASGVNVTINTNSTQVTGHVYVLYGQNANASSCTLTLAASSWRSSSSSYSIAAGTYFAMTYMGEATGAITQVLSIITGMQTI